LFESFTDRARRVVVLAQEEARLLNHSYIGTEHILLGLINEGEGVAARALRALDVSLDEARAQVERIIGAGKMPAAGHVPFTPRAKKVLELALREAMELGHQYIGTEHLLLGLIREGEGVGARVLVELGADLASTRAEVMAQLSGAEGVTEGSSWTAQATVRAERIPVEGPVCAHCRAPLADEGRITEIELRDDDPAMKVKVVYCGACGATIGLL
jgi:ATP-dependent Clp protease ATP-binding subunit ClpC